MKFIQNDCILGHNVSFDIRFISANLRKYLSKDLNNNKIDTMYLARRFCSLPSHKLEYVAKHFNISIEGHHRAMNDCMMTFEIYKNIKNLNLNL